MPLYEYLCATCGPFRAWNAMSKAGRRRGPSPDRISGAARRPPCIGRRRQTSAAPTSRGSCTRSAGRMRTRIAADIGTPATSTGLASCSEAAIRGWWGTDAVEPQGKGTPMLRVHGIMGNATDPGVAERLHRLEHDGRVEYVVLSRSDTQRKRLRAATDRGPDIAIALPRPARP